MVFLLFKSCMFLNLQLSDKLTIHLESNASLSVNLLHNVGTDCINAI